MTGIVIAVSAGPEHTFSKPNREATTLIAGFGVEDDIHAGATVKHRSRIARDASAPNLRQVHLIHSELHDELNAAGFNVAPGQMGENITTRGIELLGLPTGTRLLVGESAVLEITGLRNPCGQLNDFQQGLMNACLKRDESGNLIRKAGVMSIVLESGLVKPGDRIRVLLPNRPHHSLIPV